jgi:hypothetical protein
MADERLIQALQKAGEWKVASAFKQSTFIYGTQGSGSVIVRGLKAWVGRARTNMAATAAADPTGAKQAQLKRIVERELNLFDPGRRAGAYLAGGHQMMDLYYGQKGTTLHLKRIPAIAEFVHYAMGFNGEFSMKQSGRDAYMETFKTSIEGWDNATPAKAMYNGLTATKEMSRIIRWGIQRFGGTLIFEGREVYYSQVFDPAVARIGDTDLEARDLFQYFMPGASSARFGKGTLIFYWGGRETVPTKLHFITNWTWAGGQTHLFANMSTFYAKGKTFLAIWENFDRFPRALAGATEEDIEAAVDA